MTARQVSGRPKGVGQGGTCAHWSTTVRRMSRSGTSRMRGSSTRTMQWSGSPRRTSAGRTCTCTKAGRTSSRARPSATRTWESSRRSVAASAASRRATGSACRSTSDAGTAGTARPAGRRSAPRSIRDSPAVPTAMPTWARTPAVRPKRCGCRGRTGTPCGCRRAPSTSWTSRCSRTSCRRAGTGPGWPVSRPVIPSR